MKKVMKIGTINEMHKQLELPENKYGVIVEIVNVNSIYADVNTPKIVYKELKEGIIEINSIKYSDTTEILDEVSIPLEIRAYELDPNTLRTSGIIPVDDYTPFGLYGIINAANIDSYKIASISLIEVEGVLKADVLVNPLLPNAKPNVDTNDINLFKLSFIPYTDYINNNYIIRHDANSLKSILATYMLLSNRSDIDDITLTDSNKVWVDDCSKVLIIIDSDGNISIDGSAWTNMLDVIKNMCDMFNIDFTGTELMLEIDSIIRNEKGYENITKILTEVVSTEDGKAGLLNNTIPLVSSGMYRTFTTFYTNELMELNIKKRIAKDILDNAQVAHSDSYTVTIISSNILIDEIVEAICDREVENPTSEHVYAIVSNHTEYTDLISICFNTAGLLNNFENNIDVDFGNIIDTPSNVDLTTTIAVVDRLSKTDGIIVEVKSHTLKPMYCN